MRGAAGEVHDHRPQRAQEGQVEERRLRALAGIGRALQRPRPLMALVAEGPVLVGSLPLAVGRRPGRRVRAGLGVRGQAEVAGHGSGGRGARGAQGEVGLVDAQLDRRRGQRGLPRAGRHLVAGSMERRQRLGRGLGVLEGRLPHIVRALGVAEQGQLAAAAALPVAHPVAHLVLPRALALLEARDLAQGLGPGPSGIRRQCALDGRRRGSAAGRATVLAGGQRSATGRAAHRRWPPARSAARSPWSACSA